MNLIPLKFHWSCVVCSTIILSPICTDCYLWAVNLCTSWSTYMQPNYPLLIDYACCIENQIANLLYLNAAIVLYCIVLCFVVLCCVVLCCVVLCCVVLYCIVLYCVLLYCVVLCCVVLYCIVLYCIVWYCRVL